MPYGLLLLLLLAVYIAVAPERRLAAVCPVGRRRLLLWLAAVAVLQLCSIPLHRVSFGLFVNAGGLLLALLSLRLLRLAEYPLPILLLTLAVALLYAADAGGLLWRLEQAALPMQLLPPIAAALLTGIAAHDALTALLPPPLGLYAADMLRRLWLDGAHGELGGIAYINEAALLSAAAWLVWRAKKLLHSALTIKRK
ncbi:MAG: hypothetical protein Q4B96_06480 [Bacillota bacterium]|nr:hypothetical protein [Bacillota bacterium]